MITITKNGRIKSISKRTYEILKGQLDGWEVVGTKTNERAAYEKPREPVKQEPAKEPEAEQPTREEMMAYLAEKGSKPHPSIGDEKLKQRYELEIQINKP